MNKKSQITLFILIAIVIIGAMSYFFLFKQKAIENPLDQLKKEAQTISGSDSIKFYVENCIEQATKEAVTLVGLQGGYIYDNQAPGTITFLGPGGRLCPFVPTECRSGKNFLPYVTRPLQTDNVSFAIKIPTGGYMLPPEYPYRGNLKATDKLNTFGAVVGGERSGSIIELCYADGPNNRSISGAEHSCFDSYSTLGKSIQTFLERYIENKTLSCANFNKISPTKGVIIEPKNITAKVLIGDTNLLVSVNYDLQLRFANSQVGARQALRTLADFSYQLDNVRLKQIYELAYYLAQAETSSISFDVSSPADVHSLISCTDPVHANLKTSCLKEGMTVTRISSPCPTCEANKNADIIQIKDEHSKIDDTPLIFQFAIANRPPALDYINLTIPLATPYRLYLDSLGKAGIYQKRTMRDSSQEANQNIIVGYDDTLEVYPLALDPDNDAITFNYILFGTDPIGQLLSQSSLFTSSQKNSEATLLPSDIGPHKFRLSVGDGEYSDWQDLNLLVCNSYSKCVDCSACDPNNLCPTATDPCCDCDATLITDIKYCCS